jgi:hypothetical protein
MKTVAGRLVVSNLWCNLANSLDTMKPIFAKLERAGWLQSAAAAAGVATKPMVVCTEQGLLRFRTFNKLIQEIEASGGGALTSDDLSDLKSFAQMMDAANP